MGTTVVTVRLPEELIVEIRRRFGSISSAVRKIVEQEIKKTNLIEELEKIRVKWIKKPERNAVDLIRDDRDEMFR